MFSVYVAKSGITGPVEDGRVEEQGSDDVAEEQDEKAEHGDQLPADSLK